jgi:Fe-S cluster assembly ATP-binding protein
MGLNGLRPDAGQILLDGADITHSPVTERARRGLTLAWQSPVAFDGLTVRDYLSLSHRNARTDDHNVEEDLRRVGLSPDRYMDRLLDEHLSGGERRRIELAAVVAMRPRLAILDEPDSGIDFLSLDEIAGVIRYLSTQGAAVLLITHREEMALMASQSSLMCAGTILATGEPHAVTAYFRQHCDDCKRPNLPDLARIAHELR